MLKETESGNAMIYVLIIIALFASLSFILARQNDTSETGILATEKIELFATSLIQASASVKNSLDQMMYSGTDIDEMDFILPSDGNFDIGSNIHKVFHPEGGGVILPRIPDEAVDQFNDDPQSAWYLGSFNNVEWTQSTATDVILVAHQIQQSVCAKINEKLTGSSVIPALGSDANELLIDANLHSNGPNSDLDTAECAACDGYPQLCVTNNLNQLYSYYSVVAQR
jgi:hypothetical protein